MRPTDMQLVKAGTRKVERNAFEKVRYNAANAFMGVLRGLYTAAMVAGATQGMLTATHTVGDALGSSMSNKLVAQADLGPTRNDNVFAIHKGPTLDA